VSPVVRSFDGNIPLCLCGLEKGAPEYTPAYASFFGTKSFYYRDQHLPVNVF